MRKNEEFCVAKYCGSEFEGSGSKVQNPKQLTNGSNPSVLFAL